MDVTPQVINEVEFHQKMRGYDPDEVDDFLERVAVAVEQLQERIRQLEQRAVAAERRAAEIADRAKTAPQAAPAAAAAPVNEAEETEAIRRTLVLAQRTADAAVKEAEEEAKRTLQGAQEQVQRLFAEAQEQARKLVLDAESDARKASEDTRQRLVKEIVSLEETRDALRADQGILERHLDEQRLRLRSSIGELQRLLDDPARLRAAAPPDLSGATRPELVDDSGDVGETPATAHEVAAADEAVIDLKVPMPGVDERVLERAITGSVTFTPADEADAPSTSPSPTVRTPRPGQVAVDDENGSDAWVRFAKREIDSPPRRAPRTRDAGEDAFLTELRKARLDDTSASTLEPGEHRTRPRFGRRR